MIGSNYYSVIEFEFFVMVYVVVTIHQLIKDGLLYIQNIPSIILGTSLDTLQELSQRYPLPNYELMADYGYTLLKAHNKDISFTKNELYKLFVEIEANNGYAL